MLDFASEKNTELLQKLHHHSLTVTNRLKLELALFYFLFLYMS